MGCVVNAQHGSHQLSLASDSALQPFAVAQIQQGNLHHSLASGLVLQPAGVPYVQQGSLQQSLALGSTLQPVGVPHAQQSSRQQSLASGPIQHSSHFGSLKTQLQGITQAFQSTGQGVLQNTPVVNIQPMLTSVPGMNKKH